MTNAAHFRAAMSRYFALDGDDCRLLEGLERRHAPADKDRVLWRPGARVKDLFILQSGWACTVRDTGEGERQIIELLLPGDIIGLREFTFRRHGSEARMISAGSVSAFTHQQIVDLVAASTSLAFVLFATIGRQEALLTERMLVTLHRSARVQVSHFVLETYLRLSKLQSVDPRRMPFPVSQRLLGEILGLSSVHINRTLTALERDGVLEKHRAHVIIHDTHRLYAEAEFDDDYLSDRVDGLSRRLAELREEGASPDLSQSDS